VSAFTPGPWHVGADNRQDHLDVLHSDVHTPGAASAVIAKVTRRASWMDEQAANAELIAASPDLFDGCALFIAACQSGYGIKPEWDDERIYDELPSSALAGAYFTARAALAKATPA
jgi:hypothetical protein